jgi:hypothetical protein
MSVPIPSTEGVFAPEVSPITPAYDRRRSINSIGETTILLEAKRF